MLNRKIISPLFCFLVLMIMVSSSHAGVVDFCVADLTAAQTPAGYPCKPAANVTVDDFIYSGLTVPGKNTKGASKAVSNLAFVDQFPGLNGMGISLARENIFPGGAIPMHMHDGASEIILVARGTIVAGFIASDNTAYWKTLKEGEVMVLPQGLLHFQVNHDETEALVWTFFSSHNPGVQLLSPSLFSNNLPSELIEKTTFLDDSEVKRLKALFGGSD